MSKHSNIICGPPLKYEGPKVSLGRYLLDNLRQKTSQPVLIDARTDSSMTSRAILSSAIQTGLRLRKAGLKKGDVVAILSENRLEYATPILATAFIGAVLQPISADLTLRELCGLFAVSGPKCVFYSTRVSTTVGQLKARFSSVKLVVELGACEGDDLGQVDVDGFEAEEDVGLEDLAYVFCSSGTTGLPKCVMITQSSAVHAIELFRTEFLEYQEGDVTVSVLPFSHVFGFLLLMSSLTASAKHVLMDKFEPDLYLSAISTHRPNKISCAPSLVKFLMQSPMVDHYDLSSLAVITVGGCALQRESEEALQKRLGVVVRQGYGATETAASICSNSKRAKAGSCGVVMPTMMAKVCDAASGEALGPNEVGEIRVKGACVMRGYLGNADATDAAFDREGFYRSGDVGYYDADGFFFIVARSKEIIKYKGYQVSPTELEDVIVSHPSVADAAVVGVPDERAGEVPMAYVVLKPQKDLTENEIVDFVSEHVSYRKWLYGGVRFVEIIPRTSSGKIKRKELMF